MVQCVDVDKIMYSLENIPCGVRLETSSGNSLLIFPVRERRVEDLNVSYVYLITADSNKNPITTERFSIDNVREIIDNFASFIKDWKVI